MYALEQYPELVNYVTRCDTGPELALPKPAISSQSHALSRMELPFYNVRNKIPSEQSQK
jgi:hypothetical protein